MRNLTEYNDQFILNLIKQVKGNPYKCTANVQYAVEGNHLIPVLVIYQDNSKDWDIDDAVLFCERTEAVDFCDEMCITPSDVDAVLDFYQNVEPLPDPVHDKELYIDELLAEDYWMDMYEAMLETQLSCRY